MERYPVEMVGIAAAILSRLSALVLFRESRNGSIDRTALLKDYNEEFLEGIKDLKVSRPLKWQAERVAKRISEDDCKAAEISIIFRELHNNFIAELTQHQFLKVADQKSPYYEQKTPIFGMEVSNAFPPANNDISAAGRCLALDEWTACVFHLMRILEIGLRDMAKIVGLDGDTLEFDNWHTIIDKIQKEIGSLQSAPKSPTKSKSLKFYSEAATSFSYFKDAWRNYVSHAHEHYDEHNAIIIFNSVQAFMQTLAKHVLAEGQR